MMVIIFHTLKGLEQFKKSQFGGGPLCMEGGYNGVDLPSPLGEIFAEIEENKIMVEKTIEEHIKGIDYAPLKGTGIIGYANGLPNWRERSFLMRLGVNALSKEFTEPVLLVASSVELLQTSMFIVNEVLDKNGKCGDKESVYERFGPEKSITASNILISLSVSSLLRAIKNTGITKNVTTLLDTFNNIIYDTYVGQFIDISPDPNIEDYFEKIARTYGSQLAGALKIACLLVEADKDKSKILEKYGKFLGMAMQLRNDIIKIIGAEQIIGDNDKDILKREKGNLPYLFLQRMTDLQKMTENPPTKADLKKSIPACKEELKSLVAKAVAMVDTLPRDETNKSELAKGLLKKFAKMVGTFYYE